MPAYTVLRSRMVVGATLLALIPGCAVEYARSDSALGASSGGGVAYIPLSPPPTRTPPVASAPVLPSPRDDAPGAAAAAARDARQDASPSPTITLATSAGDTMQIAVPPKHGTVAISSSGRAAPSVRYTPTPGYRGDDQFSLSLAGGRQTVIVSIVAGSP